MGPEVIEKPEMRPFVEQIDIVIGKEHRAFLLRAVLFSCS